MIDKAFLNREYNNRELVPEHGEIFKRWAADSAQARASMICYLERRYGPGDNELLDIFPARKGDGTCLMFIHGGYWRSLDKGDFSFLAPALVDSGISLVSVNYDLCPKVSIEEIVKQMLRASAWLYRHAEQYGMDEDRLYVAGHSAGAQLAAMMMAALWQVYERDLPKDLFKGALAISGVHDLRPLLHVDAVKDDLKLDEASALKVSPAFLPLAWRAPVVTAVGGNESSEFKRQNRLLSERWRSAVTDVSLPGLNHFTAVDPLADPSSALFQAVRRMMKLDR